MEDPAAGEHGAWCRVLSDLPWWALDGKGEKRGISNERRCLKLGSSR